MGVLKQAVIISHGKSATQGSGQAHKTPILRSLETLEETYRQSAEESLELSTAGAVAEYETIQYLMLYSYRRNATEFPWNSKH